MNHDIVIRGGDVYDGTGAAPVQGDVAIDDGLITSIGDVSGNGKREINATGQAVSPGFIDLHTHMDAQICWDPSLTPICWHGVTTALIGNCGVTFAPCRPDDRELLAGMMETVEDIPKHAILTGLPWDWESYGEYLDSLEKQRPGINVAGMVGHCAVRFYVMGERAVEEPATADERRQMADIVEAAVAEGAVGFSTNRLEGHRLPDGRSIPGTYADPIELVEIANRVKALNGLVQFVGGGEGFQALTQLRDTQSRILFSYGIENKSGSGRERRAGLDSITKNHDMTAITQVRGTGFMVGLQGYLPFKGSTWDKLRNMGIEDRLTVIQDGASYDQLIKEAMAPDASMWPFGPTLPVEFLYYLGDDEVPNYNIDPALKILNIAKAAGEHWAETFLRLSRETEGRAFFFLYVINGNLDELKDLLSHERIYPSLGDAGAHVSQFIDAGWTSFVLRHWVRDTGLYTLAEGIRRLTSGPARVIGLSDRGVLKPGMRADINVFDPGEVSELRPQMAHDFPGGAPRYIQKAKGYKATIVNGEVHMLDGECTGARAGQILRPTRT